MNKMSGRRVLVVEDEPLIGLEIEQMLLDSGVDVVGPVGSVVEALRCLDNGALDGAVLDINLGTEDVFAVADALADGNVPFMFLTGHSDSVVPLRHRDRPIVRKPYLQSRFLDVLSTIVVDGGRAVPT